MAEANVEVWQAVFRDGHPKLESFQRLHRSLPPWELPRPECKLCFAPYTGLGGILMWLRGKVPSVPNPDYCTACNRFIRAYPGGAEIELTILFVDVCGSGKIAARLSPTDFSHVIGNFYKAATGSVIRADGFIIDLVGDAIVAIFPPGFVGQDHARKAIRAAENLLSLIMAADLEGTPLPIGIGVHTGVTFVGTFEGAKGGIQEVRVVGDSVNVAAGLSQLAGPGEALVSASAFKASRMNPAGLESCEVSIKDRSEPVTVYIMRQGLGDLAYDTQRPDSTQLSRGAYPMRDIDDHRRSITRD